MAKTPQEMGHNKYSIKLESFLDAWMAFLGDDEVDHEDENEFVGYVRATLDLDNKKTTRSDKQVKESILKKAKDFNNYSKKTTVKKGGKFIKKEATPTLPTPWDKGGSKSRIVDVISAREEKMRAIAAKFGK
jgi:hypothetical protein